MPLKFVFNSSGSPNQTLSERKKSIFDSSHLHILGSLLVLVLGFVLAAPFDFFSSLQNIDSHFNVIDRSYLLDMAWRLKQGEIAGQDFIFNYGPFYSVMHAMGLLSSPYNPAALLRFSGIVEVAITMCCVWALLSALQTPLRWRTALYLLWACIYSSDYGLYGGFKPMGAACLVAFCAGQIGRLACIPTSRSRQISTLALCGFLSPFLLLYSFDMGVFGLGALLLCAAIIFASTRSVDTQVAKMLRRFSLKSSLIAVAMFAAFTLFMPVEQGWKNYVKDSTEIVRAYSVSMAVGMQPSDFFLLVISLACNLLILGFCALHLRRSLSDASESSLAVPSSDNQWTATLTAVLGFACFSLLSMRSAFTRSDPDHIQSTLLPFIFLITIVAAALLHSRQYRFAPFYTLSLLVVVAVLPANSSDMIATSAAHRVVALSQFDWRPARLEITHPDIKGAMDVLQGNNARSLFVWPVQTIVNVISDKRSPNYTVQSYAATSSYLEQKTIDSMAKTPDLPVVFIRRKWAIDGVENLTRNPLIFRYLLDNYEMSGRENKHAVLLKRRPFARRNQWRETRLFSTRSSFQPGAGTSMTIPIPAEKRLSATSLLTLRMRCSKTRMLLVGKPGQCLVTFVLSNGQRRAQVFLLPPDGQSHSVLLSATAQDEDIFMRLFAPTPLSPESGATLKSLNISWRPLDALSVTPAKISVEQVATLSNAQGIS